MLCSSVCTAKACGSAKDKLCRFTAPKCTLQYTCKDTQLLRGVRQTARDVLLLSQLELTEMLDVAPAAASALLLAVSRSVVGEPNTVGCPAPPEAEVGLLALGASRAPYGASRCSNLCTCSLKRMVCDAPAC